MKTTLLAVSGLNPQVITETLFALHQQGRQVDAIEVITTGEGRNRVLVGLLGAGDGHFFRYLADYDINPATIAFGPAAIHVTSDAHGNPRPDIASAADNNRLLKLCLERAWNLTRDPESAVLFSIAGGRKTMSACLTLAAQLYGRPQDRLYHVLVTPEFEGNPNFFYPPRKSSLLELKDAQGHPYFKETRFAKITLVPVPFASVRRWLDPKLLANPADPGTLMLDLAVDQPPDLTVDLNQRKLTYRGIELDLAPAHLALYAFFAARKRSCPEATCEGCTRCFAEVWQVLDHQPQITDFYSRLAGTRPLAEMSDSGITGLTAENFRSLVSKLRRQIRERFGPQAGGDIEVGTVGRRPDTRYGIGLDKRQLTVVMAKEG